MKKGQRVKTPDGYGIFLEVGNGKCISIDVTGMYLIQLDKEIQGHWNFYYKPSEVTIV